MSEVPLHFVSAQMETGPSVVLGGGSNFNLVPTILGFFLQFDRGAVESRERSRGREKMLWAPKQGSASRRGWPLPYRGASLIRNTPLLGAYSRTI